MDNDENNEDDYSLFGPLHRNVFQVLSTVAGEHNCVEILEHVFSLYHGKNIAHSR